MATGTLVSVEEYLSSSYRPDREYIDGVVAERNSGEFDHSRLQMAISGYFYQRRKEWKLVVLPEQRIQVKESRSRVPDVCVVLGSGPFDQTFKTPPFICIEILSPEDTYPRVQEKIEDYRQFGVPYVWILDPQTRRAWAHTAQSSGEVQDGVLGTVNPDFSVPIADLFE